MSRKSTTRKSQSRIKDLPLPADHAGPVGGLGSDLSNETAAKLQQLMDNDQKSQDAVSGMLFGISQTKASILRNIK